MKVLVISRESDAVGLNADGIEAHELHMKDSGPFSPASAASFVKILWHGRTADAYLTGNGPSWPVRLSAYVLGKPVIETAGTALSLSAVEEKVYGHKDEAARHLFIAKMVRYIFSGGMAAVTNIVLYDLLIYVAHVWYVIASILAFVIAFGVSFVLQKFFTFQDHDTSGVRGQAAIYLTVTGINLVINTGLIYVFVEYFNMDKTLALILASVILAIESYIVYGKLIFKNRPSGRLA